MNIKEQLLQKIEARDATIGVVGLGYVGLPLVVAFAKVGFHVIGIDIDPKKVIQLNAGQSYIDDVSTAELKPLVESGLVSAATDYDALATVDAISICVPTPLRKTKDPDVSFILAATREIAKIGSAQKLIVLESTTYPGTTEEVILPRLKQNGEQVGVDYFLAFSPERIDPGRTDHTMWTTPKVLGGMTPACTEIALALYGTIVETPVPVSSPAAAEMVKLLENTFRAVNIGLVNEIAMMCDKLDLNVWEVIEAAATKPYGFMKFTPGPGLGGHCIPVDPHYLSWKLRTLNYTARFIELAAEINSGMPEYVVSKVVALLNEAAKAVKGSRILVIGVAYKPNVNDIRESPAIDIMHLLTEMGGDVVYHDPFVVPEQLRHEPIDVDAVDLTVDELERADIGIIVTNHANLDWGLIDRHLTHIVDTRNALPEAKTAKVIPI